ncbi:MAG: AraC family transcriptional regulator [Phyllobacterium sp.]|uniref:AraC family transcriptional regulator n=1 Tax=Phyllobacterium sp. TaxID=1871046 RepID=UPI0030F35699
MAKGQFRIYPCRVAGIEAVAASTDHVFARHFHAQYGFGLIEQGAQKSASGRGLVEAGPGAMITVNPGEIHDGAPIGDSGRAWRMLYFDPSVIAEAANEIDESANRDFEFTQPVIDDSRFAAPFVSLFKSLTETSEADSELQCDELLVLILAGMDHERRTRGNSFPAPILRAKAFIDEAPAEQVSLADLAHLCGISRFQVLRGFVRATGLTPHAYLMQRRLDLARRLIAQQTGLADAAATCGFADQSHMTRLFVRKFGISPGLYAASFS